MKTAISIPDDVFQRATRYAKKLGISRSELIARAVEQFLEEHRAREIRESYDRAFGEATADEPDDTAELRARAARKALLDVEW
jgi:metal-responsive CopG/Arc/MetJ family transcriptional regulator